MKWQESLNRVIRVIKAEEARLERDLSELRAKIASLAGVSGGSRRGPKPARKRKMSSQGRAAIARAAKRRWAAYRAAKRSEK